ncbi:MAG: CBS domain-containing protein, partial [Candidatus Micrarchaeota archaeon]|nr:CBS domain-containing protein [Candidatus Micrarchaeota archaeon]
GGVQGEAQVVTLGRDTQGMRVLDAASKSYLLVKPDMTLSSLYLLMKRSKRHIVIAKVGRGYMLADVFKKARGKAGKVREIAVPIPEVSPSTSIMDAISKMQSADASVVAVVERGRLVGVTTGSMMEAFITMHIASKR